MTHPTPAAQVPSDGQPALPRVVQVKSTLLSGFLVTSKVLPVSDWTLTV